jgi:hypothetical protein
MRILMIERHGANIQALDETLRSQLGEDYLGLSTTPGEVRLHLREAASDHVLETARVIVHRHDPAHLSVMQQAELERQQKLFSLRADNQAPLPADDPQQHERLMSEIAAKVRWLEQEIRDLRGI